MSAPMTRCWAMHQRREVEALSGAESQPTAQAGGPAANARKFKHFYFYNLHQIMVALDLSAFSVQGLRWALTLGQAAEAEVTAVHVLPALPSYFHKVLFPYAALGADRHMIEAELIEGARGEIQEVIAQAQREVLGREEDDLYIHILLGDVLARLHETIMKTGSDLLLCGAWSAQASSAGSIGLGGVSARLCAGGLSPVMVLKEPAGRVKVRRMLVAHDGTRAATELLNWAVSFALWFGAAVEVVTVVPAPERSEPFHGLRDRERRLMQEQVDRQLKPALFERFQQDMKGLYVPFPRQAQFGQTSVQYHVYVGDPLDELVRACNDLDADLVVVASRHPERRESARMGRVAAGLCQVAGANALCIPLRLLLPQEHDEGV